MTRSLLLVRRLADDRRGVAAIEFALWSTCFFLAMLGGLDVALWRTYQLRLSAAVEQGAMMAFNGRDAMQQTSAEAIGTYIKAVTHLPGAAVDVRAMCNGNAAVACQPKGSTRSCACLHTANGINSYTPATCGSPCANSAPAGYYLTITATYRYQPLILPHGVLSGGTTADSATIPLQ